MLHRKLTPSIAALMLMATLSPCTATAQPASAAPTAKSAKTMLKASTVKPQSPTKTRKLASGTYLNEMASGNYRHKQLLRLGHNVNTIAPGMAAASMAPRKADQTATLWESFEDYSGTTYYDWMPSGWTRQRTSDATDIEDAWYIEPASDGIPTPPDGDYCAAIGYSSSEKDEWLITPQVTVRENEVFSFYVYFSPVYMFNMDDENVDWDSYEFINKVKAAAVEVMVQPEGGEWTVLKDFFDDYKDMSLTELEYAQPAGFTKVSLPLSGYVGQSVKFAFRYSGTDGDSWLIDAVSVDLPNLEADYTAPASKQYFGFLCDADWTTPDGDIAIYPAYSTLTWTNATGDESATYTWQYADPESGKWTSLQTDEDLTVAYPANYIRDSESRRNFFAPPTLTASAPGAADGVYTEPIDSFKVGGTAELLTDDNEYNQYGILPFAPMNDAYSIITTQWGDDEDVTVPIFGYSDATKDFWTNRTFSGDAEEDESSEVMGYMNYIIPGDKPLVVNKVWAHALGQIADTALLKASFYALDAMGTVPEEPFITATCLGSEAIVNEGSTYNYYCLPFDFAEPVVLEGTDDCKGYLIEISGFNQGGVTWFAPVQSYYPNKEGRNLGWLRLNIHWAGEDNRSISPISNLENENGAMYCAFDINLGGYYPWLHSDVEAVSLDGEATTTVPLDSYYDASQLTIALADGSPLPSWLSAEAAGQYDKATLKLTGNPSAGDQQADVVLSAPGVSLTISVSQGTSTAIDAVQTPASAGTSAFYNVSGQRVSAASTAKGIRIERMQDGTVRKTMK